MRKVREVLRLSWACRLSSRDVARSCGIARSTVGEYVRRAQEAGLSWPLPADLDDGVLERRLFPLPSTLPAALRPLPDWAEVHAELRHKGVTLFLLWQEYKARCPEGFRYSWFCDLYRAWSGRVDLVMRQTHRAGEKLFVDYAGPTVPVADRATGEIRAAQIFVGVLGASNYTYAEATWTQTLPDWIGSHVRMFAYLGGLPAVLVPDNTKTGVTHPHRYEPDLNPTYLEMARHYGVAVVPTRVSAPRDKAKVEVGVQVVERWILARLRHRTFFSLAELNAAIAELLVELNQRPFRKLPGCRRGLFEQLDRPALKPLPASAYEYAEWSQPKVHIDYHVEVDRHYYSVPYQLVGQRLDARLTVRAVEIFHKGRRLTSHARSHRIGGYTTLGEHMPAAHREYARWTPQRLVRWAAKAGPATARAIETILTRRVHPQQGFRSCLGIMRLGQNYGDDRLEAACERALRLGACSYKSIASILKAGLDRQPLLVEHPAPRTIAHGNIRGAAYYG